MKERVTYENVNCNVCGSQDQELISERGQFDIKINLVLCKRCGLAYLNPRWDKTTYTNFYKNQYDQYYRPHLTTDRTKNSQKENAIIARMQNFNLFPDKVNDILDIGSGEGENLIDFGRYFPKSTLWAIEPSIDSQAILRERGCEIITDDVDTDWEDRYIKKFDIIIMRHVLEHFLDPISILKKVAKVLNDNGILYLAVPNNLNPKYPLESFWFRVVHTYYFNAISLKNLIIKASLKPIILQEGDHNNKHELFAFVKHKEANEHDEVLFSKNNYLKQRAVFLKGIKSNSRSSIRNFYRKFKSFLNF